MTTHQSRAHVAEPSYRDGRHWGPGEQAVLHPGRLADCALCLTDPEHLEAVEDD
jgi:hypothetical protein